MNWRLSTTILSGLAVFFLIMGCGPAAKLRRAEKLIKKAELAGAQWSIDTVYHVDTVFVPQVRVDSTFVIKPGDTVRVEKERLRVTVVRLPGDSIFVEGECAADTVVKHIPVVVEKRLEAKGGIKWWWLFVAAVVGGVILKLIFK